MKGLVGSVPGVAVASPKRRCRWLAAAGLALVFFSLVVPLGVLLGLHARFPSGYVSEDPLISENNYRFNEKQQGGRGFHRQKEDDLKISDLEEKITLKPPAENDNNDGTNNVIENASMRSTEGGLKTETVHGMKKENERHPGIAKDQRTDSNASSLKTDGSDVTGNANSVKGLPGDESGKSCQLELGSYCLWAMEHKVLIKDAVLKRLKDQLFVARSYYPSIAKLKGAEKLSREMKQNIQEHERMLSEAISDADLTENHGSKMVSMDRTIAKAKACNVECQNVEKKLRQLLDLTEDEAHFHMMQSAFLYRLGVQTLPKSFHCLSMRLTIEYFNSMDDMDSFIGDKLEGPELRHYVLFSTNVLAASVTINSTVMNSQESENMVFHLVTDEQNFYAFKSWFERNSYMHSTVEVLNFEDFRLKHLDSLVIQQLSPFEEFRINFWDVAHQSPASMRTEYISIFGHSLFLLADMFGNLTKVVLLEDDIVVQRDLSFLWNLDLGGKVIGAVQFCQVKLGDLATYMGENPYGNNSCAWMSGFNILDLQKWRTSGITQVHHELLQKLLHDHEASWRTAALPATLLTFQDLIYPLEQNWVQSGLGHNYKITHGSIRSVAALHYNGNMKPWLELGIQKYRKYWKKYLPREEQFMIDCNVNP